jgi:hypothetical protein
MVTLDPGLQYVASILKDTSWPKMAARAPTINSTLMSRRKRKWNEKSRAFLQLSGPISRCLPGTSHNCHTELQGRKMSHM